MGGLAIYTLQRQIEEENSSAHILALAFQPLQLLGNKFLLLSCLVCGTLLGRPEHTSTAVSLRGRVEIGTQESWLQILSPFLLLPQATSHLLDCGAGVVRVSWIPGSLHQSLAAQSWTRCLYLYEVLVFRAFSVLL